MYACMCMTLKNGGCLERVAPFKRLGGGVKFIQEIPRLPSGKIIRRKLKELSENNSKL